MKTFFLMMVCAALILTQSGCLETFKGDAGEYAKKLLLTPDVKTSEWDSVPESVEYFDADLKPVKQPITTKRTKTIQAPLTIIPSAVAESAEEGDAASLLP